MLHFGVYFFRSYDHFHLNLGTILVTVIVLVTVKYFSSTNSDHFVLIFNFLTSLVKLFEMMFLDKISRICFVFLPVYIVYFHKIFIP